MKWKAEEGNYTAVPNEVVEALMTTNLTAYESRVLNYIFRKTFGWHKSTDQISQRKIERNTGIDRRTVRKILQRLKKRKILLNKPFVKGGRSRAAHLGVNLNVNAWLRVGVIQPQRGGGLGRSEVGDIQPPDDGRHSTAHIKKRKHYIKKENAKDGDGSSSALLGSQKNTSPLTEKQVIGNAKYIQKNRNRPGLVKAVEETLSKGVSPEQVQRCLLNEEFHKENIVQRIRELSTEVKK